jgi:hypothetical protein
MHKVKDHHKTDRAEIKLQGEKQSPENLSLFINKIGGSMLLVTDRIYCNVKKK